VVAERFGVERLGSLLGVLYTSAGMGSAVGPPVAGVVIDATGYTPAIAGSHVLGLAAYAAVLPLSRPGGRDN
jgi:fucose permease